MTAENWLTAVIIVVVARFAWRVTVLLVETAITVAREAMKHRRHR